MRNCAPTVGLKYSGAGLHLKRPAGPAFGRDCSGALLVEFAIVAMLFFLFILGIIDIARYYSVRTVATRAAQAMLDQAETAPNFDVDLRTLNSGSTDYANYKNARTAIINTGQNLLYQVASPNTASGAMVRLKGFRPYDTLRSGTAVPFASPIDVLVLRPGDGAKNYSGSTYIEHPAICASDSTCTVYSAFGQRKIASSDSMYSLLSTFPIHVRIDIEYRPISPWLMVFGTIPIKVELNGFRELPPESSPGANKYNLTSSSTTTTVATTSICTSTTSTTSVVTTSTTSRSTTSTSTTSTTSRSSSSTSSRSTTSVSTSSRSTTSTTSRSTTSTSTTTTSTTTTSISCTEWEGDLQCLFQGKCWKPCKCVKCGGVGS